MTFTYEDLLLIPEDIRCEIFDGELILNRSRTVRHQAVLGNVATALWNYAEGYRRGVVYIGPIDVVFQPEWVLTPDIMYVRNDRKSIITERNISGAPDLTVEVLDDWTRKKDEITKRHAYEDFGVAEYWIVDPELESVKIYRRNDAGRYERVVEVSTETKGAAISSPLFPDLEIPLAEVFEE
jgi:Uma2 family endonuclease